MRIREDQPYISKVHNSVQSMLAEARRIVKPMKNEPFNYVSNNSHFEIHLPSTRISEDLKEILHLSSESYRKIDRKRRLSLIKIEDQQTIRHQNNSLSSKPIIINRLNDREQLKGVMNNFESQLIDKKFHQAIKKNKRLLYNKKAIRLLPQIDHQLSPLKGKSQSTREEENSLLEKYHHANERYTELKKANISFGNNQTKQYKTLQVPEQKKVEVLILSTLTVPNERYQRKKHPKIRNPSSKRVPKPNLKQQQINETKYTPWDLQPQQAEINF